VVDRASDGIRGFEHQGRIIELLVKLRDGVAVGAQAEAGIGLAARPVEDQASGALEVSLLLFVRGHVDQAT
jgi:hypothetical protein